MATNARGAGASSPTRSQAARWRGCAIAAQTPWEAPLLPGTENAEAAAAGAGAPPHDAPPVALPAPAFGFRLFWWLTIAIIASYQITKALVRHLLPLYGSHPVVPGLVDLVHVRNEGVAFGLLNEFNHPQKSLLTTALALVALAGIAYYARHVRHHERVARVGL